MSDQEKRGSLHDVVDAMLDRPAQSAVDRRVPPFDVDAPNQHPSKKEFEAEKSAVVDAIKHIAGFLEALAPTIAKENSVQRAVHIQLVGFINSAGRYYASRTNVETGHDLALKMILNEDLFGISLLAVMKLESALEERLQELHDQEKEFWSSRSRPPNYYARNIAVRLARLYAREKGGKPTVGASRDGGHPSTTYTRALEEVFKVLGIKAAVRRQAQWAVEQLTDNDLKPADASLRRRFAPGLAPQSFYRTTSASVLADLQEQIDRRKG